MHLQHSGLQHLPLAATASTRSTTAAIAAATTTAAWPADVGAAVLAGGSDDECVASFEAVVGQLLPRRQAKFPHKVGEQPAGRRAGEQAGRRAGR